MAELPDALSRRVGPFPVIGWLGIVGAGVGIAVVIRRSDLFGGSGEVAPVDELTEGYDDPTAAGALYSGGGLVPIAPQSNPATGTPAILTNAEWRVAAIKWAVAQGRDAVLAEQAVGHYLGGTRMSYPAGQLLRQIIAALGPAPEGAPVPDIESGPQLPPGTTLPTAPPAKPPALAPTTALHRIGEVGKTYNLRDIARRFAPNPASPDSVESTLRKIVTLNPDLKGKTTIPGGYPLRVPVPLRQSATVN